MTTAVKSYATCRPDRLLVGTQKPVVVKRDSKTSEREEQVQLRDAFFQTSRQSMANVMEKYLD